MGAHRRTRKETGMGTRAKKATGQDVGCKASAQVLLEKASGFYQGSLCEDERAAAFLRQSGLADQHLHERFGLGYCTGALAAVLPSAQSAPHVYQELKRLGLLLADGAESLHGQLTLPILDSDGGTVGIAGIDQGSGIERLVGLHPPRIWNLPAAAVHADVIAASCVMEGLSLVAADIPNVIAFIGAPGVQEHVLLKGLGVTSLAFAAEAAFAEDCQKQLAGIPCFVLTLKTSPSALLRASGAEALAAAVDAAPKTPVGPVESDPSKLLSDGFQCTFATRRYELRGIEKNSRRLKAAVRAERQGRLHVDTVDFYSSRARRNLSLDLCRFFEDAKEVIDADIDRLIRLCERWIDERPPPEECSSLKLTDHEVEEARAFGVSTDLLQQVLADYEACGLVGEEPNKLLCYLAAISRKMSDPISVMILSSSGAGKSALQEATLKLCPPEDVVKLTSMTGKALFYKGRKSLKHKILALEEEAGAQGASYPLRALISAGELIIETTVKDLGSGQLTTVQNKVEGPASVFITTTSPDTDPETRSRFFVTSVDESRAQTRRILDFQRRRCTLGGHAFLLAREAIFRKHRNFQRLLQNVSVVNPFAERLAYGDDRLQCRRDQPKLLNLIASVAFLRQMSKPVCSLTGEGRRQLYIEVDAEDLRIADELAGCVLLRSSADLNPVSFELLGEIRRLVATRISAAAAAGAEVPPDGRDVAFTRRELREFSGWPHVRVRRYLVELVEMEFITVLSGRFGATYRYCLCGDGAEPGQPGHTWSAPGHPSGSSQNPDTQVVT